MFLSKSFAAIGVGLLVLFTNSIDKALGDEPCDDLEEIAFDSRSLVNIVTNLTLEELDEALDDYGALFQEVYNSKTEDNCDNDDIRSISSISVEYSSGPRPPKSSDCGMNEYTLLVTTTGVCLNCTGMFDPKRLSDGSATPTPAPTKAATTATPTRGTKRPTMGSSGSGKGMGMMGMMGSTGDDGTEPGRRLGHVKRALIDDDPPCLLCPDLTKDLFFDALTEATEATGSPICSSGKGREFQREPDCDETDIENVEFRFLVDFDICEFNEIYTIADLQQELSDLADDFRVDFNGQYNANPDVCDLNFFELDTLEVDLSTIDVDSITTDAPTMAPARRLAGVPVSNRRLNRLPGVGYGGSGSGNGSGKSNDGNRRGLKLGSGFYNDVVRGLVLDDLEPQAGDNFPDCYCEPDSERGNVTPEQIQEQFQARIEELKSDATITCIEAVTGLVLETETESACPAGERTVDIDVQFGSEPFDWTLELSDGGRILLEGNSSSANANTGSPERACVSPCDCLTFNVHDSLFTDEPNGSFSARMDGVEVLSGSLITSVESEIGLCNTGPCIDVCRSCAEGSCPSFCECAKCQPNCNICAGCSLENCPFCATPRCICVYCVQRDCEDDDGICEDCSECQEPEVDCSGCNVECTPGTCESCGEECLCDFCENVAFCEDELCIGQCNCGGASRG